MKITNTMFAHDIKVGDVLALPYVSGSSGEVKVTFHTVTEILANEWDKDGGKVRIATEYGHGRAKRLQGTSTHTFKTYDFVVKL